MTIPYTVLRAAQCVRQALASSLDEAAEAVRRLCTPAASAGVLLPEDESSVGLALISGNT